MGWWLSAGNMSFWPGPWQRTRLGPSLGKMLSVLEGTLRQGPGERCGQEFRPGTGSGKRCPQWLAKCSEVMEGKRSDQNSWKNSREGSIQISLTCLHAATKRQGHEANWVSWSSSLISHSTDQQSLVHNSKLRRALKNESFFYLSHLAASPDLMWTDLMATRDRHGSRVIYSRYLSHSVWIFMWIAADILMCLITVYCPRSCWECYITYSKGTGSLF